MSSTTLLEASNEVLRSIGERPLLSMSGITSDRLRDVFRQALRDVEAIHTWDWLYDRITAVSWSGDTADLGNIQRLFGVSCGGDEVGYKELTWVDRFTYDKQPLTSYTGTTDKVSTYTYRNYSSVSCNPYPSDSLSRSRVVFYVLRTLTVPDVGTDVFTDVPDRYMSLVIKRASYLMALRHLDDAQAAGYFNNEYELLAQQYRNNERSVPTHAASMYRGQRRR